MKLRTAMLLAAALVLVATVCAAAYRKSLVIAYHQWRMEAAYEKLFGNPQPVGGGLAAHDVSGIDVDAVLESYMDHRQALVDLGVFCHVTASFPSLASDGSEEQAFARSDFADRMWAAFPGHRHYYLAGDGAFEAWAPVGQKTGWQRFLNEEAERDERRDTPKRPSAASTPRPVE